MELPYAKGSSVPVWKDSPQTSEGARVIVPPATGLSQRGSTLRGQPNPKPQQTEPSPLRHLPAQDAEANLHPAALPWRAPFWRSCHDAPQLTRRTPSTLMPTVDCKKLEHGCGMIYVGLPSSLSLGWRIVMFQLLASAVSDRSFKTAPGAPT